MARITGSVDVLKKRLLGVDLSKYIPGAPEGNVLPIDLKIFSDGKNNTGLYLPIPAGPGADDKIIVDVAKRSDGSDEAVEKRANDNVVTVPGGSVLGLPLGLNVQLAQEISRTLNTLLRGRECSEGDTIPDVD